MRLILKIVSKNSSNKAFFLKSDFCLSFFGTKVKQKMVYPRLATKFVAKWNTDGTD